MIKIGLKKVGFLILVCALANGMAKQGIKNKSADSLKTLSVILQSEFTAKNKVFICKNPSFADSLARALCDSLNFKSAVSDSMVLKEMTSKAEFDRYWKKVELENGITDLRGQLKAHDVDKTLIPKAYALDSSVVIYPGWIIIRGK